MRSNRWTFSPAHHLPKNNVVVNKPTDEDLRVNHYASLPHQTMYIMVDLTDPDRSTTAQLRFGPAPLTERVLCIIRVYPNGTMVLEPDFNNGKMAYIVESGNLNNEAFHYFLEHASAPIQPEDLTKERKLFREVCLRQQMHLSQMVGNEFDSVRRRDKMNSFFHPLRFASAGALVVEIEHFRRDRQRQEFRIR